MGEGTFAIPDASVEAVANAALQLTSTTSATPSIPTPLPPGWVLKESKSNPDHYYYYDQATGISTWQSPAVIHESSSSLKRSAPEEEDENEDDDQQQRQEEKQHQQHPAQPSSDDDDSKRKKAKTIPDKVRALHILKKHRGSRRPSSWRAPKITATKEEAIEELQGVQEILQEASGDPEELRATFEEIARTESDCSSAKRGGDLGFFGRKKMQPPFEEASFALQVGELSGIVETSSGVHLILRIG